MNQITTNTTAADYSTAIARAAGDANFDLDKFERLCALQEAAEIRAADRAFTAALSDAEAEMETINTNARNDQTRSKYATFAQVDGAVRPIYTRHGFGISFSSEQMGEPGKIMVVGTLSHRQGGSRRYQVPMPITTTGFKGQAMMTDTHATMAAISYGRRNLEVMMFNLAIGDDLDGNAPRQPPATPAQRTKSGLDANQYMDPETGEIVTVTTHQTPGMIEWFEKDTWQTWGRRLAVHLRTASNLDEVQQWQDLNKSTLDKLATENPTMRTGLQSSIDTYKQTLT